MRPDSCDEVVVEVVVHERRLAGGDGLARLAERVVLVAAAADGADGPAVGEDEHLRAGALRRRAVGADDRHERARLAALERGRRGGQDFFVQIRTSIFDFFFKPVDERVGVLLLLLLGEELLDLRAAPPRTARRGPACGRSTLMMW